MSSSASIPQNTPIPSSPPVPAWAANLPDVLYLRGDELRPNDIVHFKEGAYPRSLCEQVSTGVWDVIVHKNGSLIPGQATFQPYTRYVVERRAAAQITYIRVPGESLTVGDVVDFSSPVGKHHVRIEQIADKQFIPGKGYGRPAVIYDLQTDETREYTFNNFSLMDFTVVAGPNFDMALENPAMLKRAPVGFRWAGQS